jgi:hypothetical protein
VAPQSIGQNLAFINWSVLVALAVGCFGAVVLTRFRTEPTRGFLVFTAACAAAFGGLAWLSDGALPATIVDSPVVVDPAWEAPRRAALALFTVLAVVMTVVVARRARGRPVALVGVGGLVVGLAVLVLGALSWGTSTGGSVAFLVQHLLLAAATGGVFGAMVLGHWYLVTPKLAEDPLVLVSRTLLGLMAGLLAFFVVAAGLGLGVPGSDPGGDGPFAVLFGPWALFTWLYLIVGLLFPLVVSWMALQTAKTRSMESATGLLYINVGTVTAGTIVAAGVFFGAGLFI